MPFRPDRKSPFGLVRAGLQHISARWLTRQHSRHTPVMVDTREGDDYPLSPLSLDAGECDSFSEIPLER